MKLKSAALLALIGSVLLAALLLWDLLFTVVGVARGLAPADKILSSLIHAFTGLSIAVFFYVFHKAQA